MKKICVIGSNAFSGQDFVDLLLDDPNREVIGISRSPEQPDFMLRYKSHPTLARSVSSASTSTPMPTRSPRSWMRRSRTRSSTTRARARSAQAGIIPIIGTRPTAWP